MKFCFYEHYTEDQVQSWPTLNLTTEDRTPYFSYQGNLHDVLGRSPMGTQYVRCWNWQERRTTTFTLADLLQGLKAWYTRPPHPDREARLAELEAASV